MAQSVSTSQLVDDIAERTGMSKAQSKQAITAVVEALSEHLSKGNRIQLSGLGTFEVRDRAAREATNPRTREKVQVPATKAVGFRAASQLKNRVGETGEAGETTE
jgi:DNA-binding protein HU-beta